METKALDQVLGQLRSAAAMAGEASSRRGGPGRQILPISPISSKASLDQVNGMQQQAVTHGAEFRLGAPNTGLPDVMVSIQKANVVVPAGGPGPQPARVGVPRHHEHAGVNR
jgi:flagellar hook-basal body complex protein FliE